MNSQNFNYLRKVWHSLGLLIPILYMLDIFQNIIPNNQSSTQTILFFISITIFTFTFIFELLRFKVDFVQSLFLKLFHFIMKKNEKQKFTSVTPYFLSCSITLLLFPKEITIISLLFLTLGDPIASFMGSRFGKTKLKNNKSWEGFFSFVLFTFMIGFTVIYIFSNILKTDNLFLNNSIFFNVMILAITCLITGFTELFCGNYMKGLIDDNLLIPISSSLCFSLIFMSFQKLTFNELIKNLETVLHKNILI